MTFMLAWPCGETVTAGFLHSIVGLLMSPTRPAQLSQISSGPLLSRARNEIVERFLASEIDWLLQVDSDIVFTPHHVKSLLRSAHPTERPIVGGAYALPPDSRLAAGTYVDGRFTWPRLADLPAPDVGLASLGLVEVDYSGTGFLLTHRSVMEKISHHFDYASDGVGDVGEDVAFCLRAREAGFPVYLNTDVRLGHMKSQPLEVA